MKDREYIISLYDLYKKALTTKQKKYFEYYYYEDESLTEISENLKVSKAIVSKMLKSVEEKLKKYEDSFHLYEVSKLINKSKDKRLIKEIENIIYK